MSVDAGLFLDLRPSETSAAILDVLLSSGWSKPGMGWWSIPVGEECSQWCYEQGMGAIELRALFHEKVSRDEVFGVRMWWSDSDVGGEFLIFPNNRLVFSPSINRVTLDERTTDVSWYLERIIPIFSENGAVTLDRWEWHETS